MQAACTLLEADAAPVCEALERMILSEELITEREAIYLPASIMRSAARHGG